MRFYMVESVLSGVIGAAKIAEGSIVTEANVVLVVDLLVNGNEGGYDVEHPALKALETDLKAFLVRNHITVDKLYASEFELSEDVLAHDWAMHEEYFEALNNMGLCIMQADTLGGLSADVSSPACNTIAMFWLLEHGNRDAVIAQKNQDMLQAKEDILLEHC